MAAICFILSNHHSNPTDRGGLAVLRPRVAPSLPFYETLMTIQPTSEKFLTGACREQKKEKLICSDL